MEKIKSLKFLTERSIDWLPNVLKRIGVFKPEVTKFEINYKSERAKLYFRLNIPSEIKRKEIGKIAVPKESSFHINDFLDDQFQNQMRNIKYSKYDEAYIIYLNKLPESNNFLIVFEGDIDSRILNQIVRIQPAINKDNTPTHDKYWLDVMIRDIETLEKIYKSLDVNEVNCSVKVSVERYFATELPTSLKKGINALNTLISVAKGSDRQKLFSAWYQYRRSIHKLSRDELENFFKEIAKKMVLQNYIKIDSPFYIGDIGSHEIEKIIPKSFSVEALANLSLKEPAASGYLTFNKKDYQEKIKKEIKETFE